MNGQRGKRITKIERKATLGSSTVQTKEEKRNPKNMFVGPRSFYRFEDKIVKSKQITQILHRRTISGRSEM